ncbi:MAG: ABC transporter ATP-binding protein [Pseudomonadota bacterium]
MQTILEISSLDKSYISGNSQVDVLKDINLKVKEGEFVAILGYSGSGKTTLINTIAGLIKPDNGGVICKGREVDAPGLDRGLVFQSYSLMPWMSVKSNIRLAVDSAHKKLSRKQRTDLVNHYIELVGLSHAVGRKPAELSGGMRQRVSLARALAMQPDILLLDEPLSALDALTRSKLQDELAAICEQEKKTIILITNDVDEAILLADKIVPLTTAPAATLGPEFIVDLPRPRDRAAINNDKRFVELRAQVTQYLLDLRDNRETSIESTELPNVVPVRFGVPKAVREESKSRMDERYLDFSQVSKTYPTPEGPLTVVKDFKLTLDKGEFVTLIGHSGCGKSTVLSMAAGLNPISEGGIVLDGYHVESAGPERAVVFQAPSLMPWLTAFENVMLGVDRVYPKARRSERRDVVSYYLERVGLADAMHKPAADLSNGMQQRVGIARAFALSPKLLLLDEPFGMLDSLTRWQLQDVLMDVWERTRVTTVCVTHDVDEAILLADRVVMMSNGPEAKVGNIMEVGLERPRTRQHLLEHPDYYHYREELLDFLEAYEGGANPDPETLEAIRLKREQRSLQSNTGVSAQLEETAV